MAEVKRPVVIQQSAEFWSPWWVKDQSGVIVCECGNEEHANAIAAVLNATLPPDLLRAALTALIHAHMPGIVGPSRLQFDYQELRDFQARACEALARLFPEEVRTGE